MTDAEVKEFLKENGYPEHLVKAGKKGLIAQWEQFVSQVEHGYTMHLEDYRNDLDLRAILSRLGLQAEVEEADARLRRVLVFTEASVWDCDGLKLNTQFFDRPLGAFKSGSVKTLVVFATFIENQAHFHALAGGFCLFWCRRIC